jgi:hypothetical protein
VLFRSLAAAWVTMTAGFRGWPELDIAKLFARLIAERAFHFALAGSP